MTVEQTRQEMKLADAVNSLYGLLKNEEVKLRAHHKNLG